MNYLRKSKKKAEPMVFAPYFEFNTSNNPFAYIRTEDDVKVFLENVEENIRNKVDETLIDHILRFLWVLVNYLIVQVNIEDRNIQNIIKLIKCAYDISYDYDDKTTLELLLENLNDEELNEYYHFFLICVYGKRSSLYKEVLDTSVSVLESLKDEMLLNNLIKENLLYQADLYADEEIYDVYFLYSDSFSFRYFKGTNDEDKPIVSFEIPKVLFHRVFVYEALNFFYNIPDKCTKDLIINNCPKILEEIRKAKSVFEESEKERLKKSRNSSDEILQSISKTSIVPGSLIVSRLFNSMYKRTGQSWQRAKYLEETTAVHEAGHAVAMFLEGKQIKGATIEPSDSNFGHITGDSYSAVTYYAGMIAETIIFNNKYSEISGARIDFKHATTFVRNNIVKNIKNKKIEDRDICIDIDELGCTGHDGAFVIYETIKQCRKSYDKAHLLISTHIDMVKALADKLMEVKTMCGEEVEELLTDFIVSNSKGELN